MPDNPDDTETHKALEAQAIAGPPWGVIRPDGTFREIPKRPLLNAHLFTPPFDVTLPGGRVITVVEKPKEST